MELLVVTCGVGCLEIKCPYSMKDQQNTSVPWLVKSGIKTSLERNHPYYYQIQLQMFVTGHDFCDFVVWCPNDLYVERICIDTAFLKVNIEKAVTFHKLIIVPELLCRFFTRKAALYDRVEPASSFSTTNAEPVKHCTCNGDEDGRKMIMCDNENCVKQWFHMSRLGMKRVPKGKWFCKKCRSSLQKK